MKKNTVLIYLYPLLAAVYPVVFLYAYNLSEITFKQIFPYFCLAILSFLIVFMVAKLILKNLEKSAFITAFFFVWIYSYGSVLGGLNALFFVRQFVLLPIWIGIFVAGFFAVVKSSKKEFFTKTASIFTVIFVLLVGFNLIKILPYEFSRNIQSEEKPLETEQKADEKNIAMGMIAPIFIT